MFKETFNFPGWNNKGGCCWHCVATPKTVLDFSKVTERLNHWDVAMRILDKGAQISPIFECPGFGKDQCLIDWLHAVDHGVACDFIANLFWKALPQIASTRKTAVNKIFEEIKEFYEANHADSKLQTLTEKMIKQEKKPPKLRAKAAEARALVPFAVEFLDVFEKSFVFCICHFWKSMMYLKNKVDVFDVFEKQSLLLLATVCLPRFAHKHFPGDSELEKALRMMAVHLNECYKCLSNDMYDQKKLEQHCRKFCLLYTALEDKDSKLWIVKPKFHQFVELSLQNSNPSKTWTYREEDYGGFLAQMGRRRGGKWDPRVVGQSVLQRFRAKNRPVLK